MSGWSFTVVRQPIEDCNRHIDRDAVLASWMVGSQGCGWIETLVDRGDAIVIRHGGYPNWYAVPARLITAALTEVELQRDIPLSLGRPYQVYIKRDALAAYLPDELLTVIVWDQS